jgi:N-acetylglutamate synthase/N-acetylornithine aminotransferase
VGDDRFGPNTAEIEAFLERLRRLTPAEWEQVTTASPGIGAIPDLEIKQSPEYFKALDVATRAAKSNVFQGSESAFYDAMRTAQLVADASAFQPSTRPEPASSAVVDERLPPDAEAEAITRIMSTAYEEESWRRVMNACMIAAGALVVRSFITREQFRILTLPFARN